MKDKKLTSKQLVILERIHWETHSEDSKSWSRLIDDETRWTILTRRELADYLGFTLCSTRGTVNQLRYLGYIERCTLGIRTTVKYDFYLMDNPLNTEG
jgi:hypothetical protein